jgi:hypothetical protein
MTYKMKNPNAQRIEIVSRVTNSRERSVGQSHQCGRSVVFSSYKRCCCCCCCTRTVPLSSRHGAVIQAATAQKATLHYARYASRREAHGACVPTEWEAELDGWLSHARGRCLCWQGVPRRAMFSSAAGADHMAHFHELQATLDAMETDGGVSGVAGGDHAVYHAVAEAQIGEALHRLKTGHFSSTDEFKVSVARRRCSRCPRPVPRARASYRQLHAAGPGARALLAPPGPSNARRVGSDRLAQSARYGQRPPVDFGDPREHGDTRNHGETAPRRRRKCEQDRAALAGCWSHAMLSCLLHGRSSTRTAASRSSKSPWILSGTSRGSLRPLVSARPCFVSGLRSGRRTTLSSIQTTRCFSRLSEARHCISSATRALSLIPIAKWHVAHTMSATVPMFSALTSAPAGPTLYM